MGQDTRTRPLIQGQSAKSHRTRTPLLTPCPDVKPDFRMSRPQSTVIPLNTKTFRKIDKNK